MKKQVIQSFGPAYAIASFIAGMYLAYYNLSVGWYFFGMGILALLITGILSLED